MEVQVLQATAQPERLVCQCARGDYYQGYVGDTDYAELMKGVDYEEEDVDRFREEFSDQIDVFEWYEEEDLERDALLEAQTKGLIEELLSKDPHYGPFEHPQITFAVKGCPVFTERQLIRHRHLTFDVQSMRYANFSDNGHTVPATLLSNDKRHEEYPHVYNEDGEHYNRDEGHFQMDEESRAHWRNAYNSMVDEQMDLYEDMVEAGFPKEDARAILGLGTNVNFTVSGNARSFLHILDMRRKQNAQWNIRELSELMLEELFDWMPYTYNYYKEHGPNKLSP